MDGLLADFRWADHGAGEDAVRRAEAALGALPPDYVNVLRAHDGGEGFVGGGAYLSLSPVEDLEQMNAALEAGELVPGVVLIGGDGADDLYGIESSSGTYWIFPAIGLRADSGEQVADGWERFLQALSGR